MKIGVITYDYPHLKTEQAIQSFLRRGYRLKMYALPFEQRRRRHVLFQHRPDQATGIHPAIIAEAHGIEYIKCESDADIDSSCVVYHVLIGRIISAECIQDKTIINCHPGIIPAVRGLDTFKWAILDKQPLGVTLHYIDAEVDAGEIIAIVPTPVYETDTPETLARRHYENEIDTLSDFECYIDWTDTNAYSDIQAGDLHMRMGRAKELEMMESFGQYVQEVA